MLVVDSAPLVVAEEVPEDELWLEHPEKPTIAMAARLAAAAVLA
jgi:hypothetical protein